VFAFGTKAQTLERLSPLVSHCSVPDFLYFTVGEWRGDSEAILRRISSKFGNCLVAVRSSACSEDGSDQSLAGMFESILNVNVNIDENSQLTDAVQEVIRSYQRGPFTLIQEDHILVQRMVDQVEVSGVLLSQDINTGAPYYVISYDDETGRTDTVTAGNGNSERTLYIHRGAFGSLRSPRFRGLVSAVLELEGIVGSRSLDVEFAIDKSLHIHLLQVRRIAAQPNWNRRISLEVDKAILQIQSFVRDRFKPCAHVRGRQSVFGQMPDWNPAEMIGRTPRPLALSLYRRVITDRVWRVARRQMGYAEPIGAPLMVSFGGQPYIDVRLSFHSFLPADLPEEIGEKLVNAWLDRLIETPSLHDKIEFDVAVTAYTFDFDERVSTQFPNCLDEEEIDVFRRSLKRMTNNLLSGHVAPISSELEKIEELASWQAELSRGTSSSELGKVTSFLEYCSDLGTLPFSVLARHGFIAQSLLKSLVFRRIFTSQESERLLRSIKTIAGEFTDDTQNLAAGKLDQKEFMARYGHLRPGTYDILSPRYDQRDSILSSSTLIEELEQDQGFALTEEKAAKIQACLDEAQFDISAHDLIEYIRKATAAREYAKFVFTKNISDALEGIASWGESIGLSREELSLLKVDDILDCMITVDGENIEDHLRSLSDAGAERYSTTQALRLPQLLYDEEGAHVVPLQVSQPNFITLKNIVGECVLLDGHDVDTSIIVNKIVLIENADPGFDWIFAHGLIGLVTMFGGVNSHMAIRCAEFGLPAAIGCGEQIFEHLRQAKAIEIKCAESQIHRIEH
jgi:glutamine kinase